MNDFNNTIQKKKEDRFKFLHKVYEITEGQENYMVNMWQVGQEIGLNRNETSAVFDYLQGQGLVEPMALGGGMAITHYGIVEVESALDTPDEPTTYFPPVNIIHVGGNMDNVTIQQSTHNSTINIISNDTINHINNYVETLDDFINNQVENADLKNELRADIETIKQQLQSPKPKSSIIKATLLSTKEVLIGAMGGLLGNLAQPKTQELIQMIGNLVGEITS